MRTMAERVSATMMMTAFMFRSIKIFELKILEKVGKRKGHKDWYKVYQELRLNLGKISEIFIFESLLTTFEARNIFVGSSENCLTPKIK